MAKEVVLRVSAATAARVRAYGEARGLGVYEAAETVITIDCNRGDAVDAQSEKAKAARAARRAAKRGG